MFINISFMYILIYITLYIMYCTYHILYVSHHAECRNTVHIFFQTASPWGAGHVWCRSSGSLGRSPGGWRWENFKDAIATWRRSRALEKKWKEMGKMSLDWMYTTLLLENHTLETYDWSHMHNKWMRWFESLLNCWHVTKRRTCTMSTWYECRTCFRSEGIRTPLDLRNIIDSETNPNDSWWNYAWHRMNPVHTRETVNFDTDFTPKNILLLWLALL